jgi:hypothetical protein
MTRRRVLAVTTSPLPVEEEITDGPGYRMWNLLHEIARHHDVQVLSLYESFHLGQRGVRPVLQDGIRVERPSHSPRAVQRRIAEIDPDILYLPWSCTPFLGKANRDIPTILDYVGAGLLEDFLAHGATSAPLLRIKLHSFWYGDFLATTTARERFYLIGLLAASGRLSEDPFPRTDPMIHVVRMTPPAEPPIAAVRLPERQSDELVALLAGAFLPWYDYGTLASAVRTLHEMAGPQVRLVVMGGNPRMPAEVKRVKDLFSGNEVREGVEFVGTVPFSKRAEYYLGADVALSIAPDSVENELSARTRIVDFLWARLPPVTSGGDEYSTEILAAGAGFRYESSPESLATVLAGLATNRSSLAEARGRMEALLQGPFNPAVATEPVLRFLEEPRTTKRRIPRGFGAGALGIWLRDVTRAIRTGRL